MIRTFFIGAYWFACLACLSVFLSGCAVGRYYLAHTKPLPCDWACTAEEWATEEDGTWADDRGPQREPGRVTVAK